MPCSSTIRWFSERVKRSIARDIVTDFFRADSAAAAGSSARRSDGTASPSAVIASASRSVLPARCAAWKLRHAVWIAAAASCTPSATPSPRCNCLSTSASCARSRFISWISDSRSGSAAIASRSASIRSGRCLL